MPLFLLLLIVPVLEIMLFIEVGGILGTWPTILIVIATAVAGSVLIRSQGRQTLEKLQRSLQGSGNPVDPLAHGALILIAGVLLLTPGFFTDAVGLALMSPVVRRALISQGAAKVAARAQQTRQQPPDPRHGGPRAHTQHGPAANDAADIEDAVVLEETPAPNDRSDWRRPDGSA